MIRRLGLGALAVLACLAVAGEPAIAGPALASGGRIPFLATYSGAVATTGPATLSFNGAGYATHMGRITNAGTVDLNGPATSCTGGIANVNTETLTDQHGDTLTIVSVDVACPTGPGQVHGTGQWTVSGGTGRFAGVKGRGSAFGHADFNAGTFTMSLDGVLGPVG